MLWLKPYAISARLSCLFLMSSTPKKRIPQNNRYKQRTGHTKKDTSSLPHFPSRSSNTSTHPIYRSPPSLSSPAHNGLCCGSEQCVQAARPPTANSRRKREEARSVFCHLFPQDPTTFDRIRVITKSLKNNIICQIF
jgi:hypothetical protein